MKSVMVTGARGLLGSVVCTQLAQRGDKVRAIARDTSTPDIGALRALGVEVVKGDITDLDSVRSSLRGIDAIIHPAAVLGRPGTTFTQCYAGNVVGTTNVLTAAAMQGGMPVVQVATTNFFDMSEKPLTEFSPIDLHVRNDDQYSFTKRLSYVEGLARVADGQDIRFVLPGGIFGPSVCKDYAMVRPGFNDMIALAIRGEMDEQIPFPIAFTLVDDCAYVCISALDRGLKGERYIANGKQENAVTVATMCNRACELAGTSHRVRDVPREKWDDPEVIAKYTMTMITLAKTKYPDPYSDTRFTQERLGCKPTALDVGLKITIDWLRGQKII